MPYACIDIGSNTTRVLVAEVHDGALTEVLVRRSFTRIGRDLSTHGALSERKIDEVTGVVAEQKRVAEEAGARTIRTVATQAIRTAANRAELEEALRERAGVMVDVLDGEQEARLAFLGATRTYVGPPLRGRVAVVDVGGGSSEIAVGYAGGDVEWWTSFPIGSGLLCDAYLRCDPPSPDEVERLGRHAAEVLGGIDVPRVDHAVAVGGSAASLTRLLGGAIEPQSLKNALRTLTAAPAAVVAERLGLAVERVTLMPAGILVLDAVTAVLGQPLTIGRGGLREGVCLQLAGIV